MSQEKKPGKPDPIEDVREGLGLLFRAAKNAVKELPTDKLEETLKTGVREVAHAVESVAGAIEREVFGGSGNKKPDEAAKPENAEPENAKPENAQPEANGDDKVRVAGAVTTSPNDSAAAPPPDPPPPPPSNKT